jgi:hypothetical protein
MKLIVSLVLSLKHISQMMTMMMMTMMTRKRRKKKDDDDDDDNNESTKNGKGKVINEDTDLDDIDEDDSPFKKHLDRYLHVLKENKV